jgi:hypothetical protein
MNVNACTTTTCDHSVREREGCKVGKMFSLGELPL